MWQFECEKNINNTTQTVEDRRIFDRKMVRTNLRQLTAVFLCYTIRKFMVIYSFVFIAISFDWCRLLMLACRAIILIQFSSLNTSFIACFFFPQAPILRCVCWWTVSEYNESIILNVQFIMNPDIFFALIVYCAQKRENLCVCFQWKTEKSKTVFYCLKERLKHGQTCCFFSSSFHS